MSDPLTTRRAPVVLALVVAWSGCLSDSGVVDVVPSGAPPWVFFVNLTGEELVVTLQGTPSRPGGGALVTLDVPPFGGAASRGSFAPGSLEVAGLAPSPLPTFTLEKATILTLVKLEDGVLFHVLDGTAEGAEERFGELVVATGRTELAWQRATEPCPDWGLDISNAVTPGVEGGTVSRNQSGARHWTLEGCTGRAALSLVAPQPDLIHKALPIPALKGTGSDNLRLAAHDAGAMLLNVSITWEVAILGERLMEVHFGSEANATVSDRETIPLHRTVVTRATVEVLEDAGFQRAA